MTTYNKSAILTEAWRIHRDIHKRYAPWQIKRGVVDASFSNALKRAWSASHEKARLALAKKIHADAFKRIEERRFALEMTNLDITDDMYRLRQQEQALIESVSLRKAAS